MSSGRSAWRTAGLVAIGLAGVALAVVAFRFHPVGDYFTESDFYASYAPGADRLRHGHFDPSRYGIAGPVYELALALVSLLAGDLFTAARLISVASAIAVLALAWWVTVRRYGPVAACGLVILVAMNPVFFRYGYSACGDMLACALWMASAAAVLELGGWAGPIAGGVLAALAALTRYNLVSLLPAGLLVLLVAPRGPRGRWTAALAYLAAFLALVAPFTLMVMKAGHLPGQTLLSDAAYYLEDAPSLTLEQRYGGSGGGSAVTGAPLLAAVAMRTLRGVGPHLATDGGTLLGWPAAALAAASLIGLLARRRAAALLPLVPYWAFGFLALAPVFASDRYSMVLLPLYLLPAAVALGLLADAGRRGRIVAWAAGLLVAGATLAQSVALQRLEYASLPVETLESGRRLRQVAQPGERVLARKAHVAYAAGLEPVLFPDLPGLDSLGAFCRARDIRYLYFSWYEARLRPGFSYLLDPTASVPGLAVVHATEDKPSVTYRVGPELGATPAWWWDEVARQRVAEHVAARLAPSGAPSH